MAQYDRLRELLEKEVFPHSFIFKFIGKNSPLFEKGVRDLEQKHPALIHQTRRESGNQKHVSLTYAFEASSPQSIVEVYESIAQIQDVVMTL